MRIVNVGDERLAVGEGRLLTDTEKDHLKRMFAQSQTVAISLPKVVEKSAPQAAKQVDPNSVFDSFMPFLFSPAKPVAKQAPVLDPLSAFLAGLTEQPVEKAARRESGNPNDCFGDFLPRPLGTVSFT